MYKISSIKGLWVVGVLLIAVLFLVLLYPQSMTSTPLVFQRIFKILVFIAIFSFTIFLLVELSRWHSKAAERLSIEKSKLETSDHTDEDFVTSKGLRLNVDPDKNYEEMTAQLLKSFNYSLMAQTAFIYLYNKDEGYYIRQGYFSMQPITLVEKFQPEGTLFESFHLSDKTKIFSADQIGSDDLVCYNEKPKVGSLMLVPITVGKGYFVGLLGADSVDPEAWGEDDINLASSFSKIFSISVWQIDTIDKLKTNTHFFNRLCKINSDIPLGVDQLDLYKEIGNLCRMFFNFDKLTLATLKDEEDEELFIDFVEGCEADYSIGHTIVVEGSMWEGLMRDNHKLEISDYEAGDIEFRFQPGDLASSPFHSCIGVPFVAGQKRVGGLLLESFQSNAFLSEDIEVFELLGKNIGSIMNRMNIYQSMKDLAMVDGLTGIYNHRAFKERFREEIDRCKRYGTVLTLLFLDLDKFKRINDTYGHLFGDFVLKKTVSLIRGSVRTIDTVARYGGEEFAVILINANKKNCFATAERIRSNIQNFLFEKDRITERITISIGMSEFPSDGDDIQSIIANADMAMYESKKAGGNKVVVFDSQLET